MRALPPRKTQMGARRCLPLADCRPEERAIFDVAWERHPPPASPTPRPPGRTGGLGYEGNVGTCHSIACQI